MKPDHDQILLVGDNLHLKCCMTENTGNDTAFNITGIKILFKGKNLPSKAVQNYEIENNSLDVFVPNVTHDDTGMYWCCYIDPTVVQRWRYIHIASKLTFPTAFFFPVHYGSL